MRRGLFVFVASILLLTITASAQEMRNEVSAQGTGFFTKDSTGDGIYRTTTKASGLEAGYRYHFNHWLSTEINYGYARNTQKYFSGGVESRVQSDVHAATMDAVFNLPLRLSKLSTYALGGGGALVFRPTGNNGGTVPGADTKSKGAFVYGGGINYPLTQHFFFRAEYRGFVYKDPDFGLTSLHTDTWSHIAQPSAGIMYRF